MKTSESLYILDADKKNATRSSTMIDIRIASNFFRTGHTFPMQHRCIEYEKKTFLDRSGYGVYDECGSMDGHLSCYRVKGAISSPIGIYELFCVSASILLIITIRQKAPHPFWTGFIEV